MYMLQGPYVNQDYKCYMQHVKMAYCVAEKLCFAQFTWIWGIGKITGPLLGESTDTGGFTYQTAIDRH